MGDQLTRRELAELLGSFAVLTLTGCSQRGPVPASPSTSPTPEPAPATSPAVGSQPGRRRSDFLERLRAALRTSPDHLAARADELVAARDPLRAIRFVRQEIAALPAPFPTLSGLWGVRGTLRSGAGSLRDRADLLAYMLTRMGYTARIRDLPRPSELTAADIWAAVRSRRFAPEPKALDALCDEKKLPRPAPDSDPIDAAERDAITSVADMLLALLPAEQRAATRTMPLELPDRIPVVDFEARGRRAIAVALGNLDVIEDIATELREASATDYPRVEVAVLAAFNPPPGSTLDGSRTHELLRASWPADQLCGRRLTLAFAAPGRGLKPSETPWQYPTRMPILRLSDAHGFDADARRVAVGQMVTMFGGTYAAAAPVSATPGAATPPQYVGPYGPLRLAGGREALARNARALDARLRAMAFPDIALDVSLRDARGASVSGLAAADFVVTEDGQPQAAFVIADQAPVRPRVLVLWDGSGSASGVLKTEDERNAFRRSVADALVSAAQSAPFDVQVVGIDGTPRESAWVAPDVEALVAAMTLNTTSDGWIGLGRGVPAAGAAVAIEISDNELTDDAVTIPALRAQLKACDTPVIVIPIGRGGESTTADIVRLSGGQEIRVNDPALVKVVAATVGRHVAVAAAITYRIRYRASNRDAPPAPRRVTVALAANPSIKATATYTPPAAAERSIPGGLAGLYLQIRMNGETEVRRLGGVELDGRGTPLRDQLDAARMDEAASAAFGLTTLAFEPGVASTAEMLDDTVRALIALDPFLAAIPGGEAALTPQARVVQRTPPLFARLFDPVGGITIAGANSMRVAVYTEATGQAAGKAAVIGTVDLPPALNRTSSRGTPAAAFRATMLATLATSYRESQLAATSALGGLQGRKLRYVAPLSSWSAPPGVPPMTAATLQRLTRQYEAWHRFVSADGRVEAMWIVDPATGSSTLIDAAGRGGIRIPTPVDGYCFDVPLDKPSDFKGAVMNALFWLDLSAALISAYCTLADVPTTDVALGLGVGMPGTGAGWACVGATVEGVGSLTLGSFISPVSVGTLPWAFNAFGTVVGAAQLGMAATGGVPGSMKLGVRTVQAVIFLMIAEMSLSSERSNC